eukprot:Blabericola_migrator_1__3608@NODE_2076_length_3314_cov_161_211888_g1315_i0_p2_GENE_NODE_2076_length_3314_cov_161_211888_g1315_i0NODE_2076_length_3314_cov_161_211888_g1315_i0_p2_ORF_typecomplete_len275_score26_14_NODE_2076_length_3314_cov_161_211888_g1315_i018942718
MIIRSFYAPFSRESDVLPSLDVFIQTHFLIPRSTSLFLLMLLNTLAALGLLVAEATTTTKVSFVSSSGTCPESCNAEKMGSLVDLRACQIAVEQDAASNCAYRGTYTVKGDDSLSYECKSKPEDNSLPGYFNLVIPSLEPVIGVINSNSTATVTVTEAAACKLYEVAAIPVPDAANTYCSVDSTKVDAAMQGTPFLTVEAGTTSFQLEADAIRGVKVLVGDNYSNCLKLDTKAVTVDLGASFFIQGAEASSSSNAVAPILVGGSAALYCFATLF